MPIHRYLLCLAALTACQPESTDVPDSPQAPNPSNSSETIVYTGPPIQDAEIEILESFPEQYYLSFGVEVPSGGYELSEDSVTREAGKTIVDCRLTAPGSETTVTTALETLRLRLPLVEADRIVHIRIAQWRHGEHPIVAPPHELARIVSR